MYLGHSGFVIETPNATMLFDWYQGKLPTIRSEKPLCVFVSHIHSDHFNPEIFNLVGNHPNSEIYLGYDHSVQSFDEMLSNLPKAVQDKICFFDGEQKLIVDIGETDIIVNTLRSTDMGVAFLIHTDDKTYFHAGDLFLMQTVSRANYLAQYTDMLINHPDEQVMDYETYLKECETEFNSFTEPLRGKTIDFAMIPVDPRFGDVAYKTVKRYMNIADIKFWSPIHLWGKYEYVDEFLTHHPEYSSNMIGISSAKGIKKGIQLNERFVLFEEKSLKEDSTDILQQRNWSKSIENEESAWGPTSRDTFKWGNPSDYVVFNSMTDNPKTGDERNFVRIRKYSMDTKFSDKVELEVGEEYEVAVWFDNNAKPELNKKENGGVGIAENVRLRIECPEKVKGKTNAVIKGIISSTNSKPEEIWDTAYAYTGSTVLLRYVPNSAIIHSLGTINGQILSSKSMFGKDGVKLGYWEDLWGTVPGGSEYAGYITFRMKVDQPGFKLSSLVSIKDKTNYQRSIVAKPGDILEFQLSYENTGTINQKAIKAYDYLPDGLVYIKGSTSFETVFGENKTSDNLFNGGMNLGDYEPGDWVIVRYQVKVEDNKKYFPEGDTVIYNDASIATANGTGRNIAEIIVRR